MKQIDKEALKHNLDYRLEVIQVGVWENFYLEQVDLKSWIKENDYEHYDDMLENVKLACEEHETPLRRFFTRLSRGYSISQAVEKSEQRDDKFYNIPVEFGGKYYGCINDLMREHHTSRDEVIRKMRDRSCGLKAALFLLDADYSEKRKMESTSKPDGASDSVIAKRKKAGWPEQFQSYLYFSNEDIVALSSQMKINPSYLLALKQSGYSMEWATKTLKDVPENGVEGVLEEEFARRIYAGWDYHIAINPFSKIKLDGNDFPTPIDLLQASAESFKIALNSFQKGESVFDILEIKPIAIETESETLYFTTMDAVSKYYNFEKANLCSLVNTGLLIEDAVKLDPKALFRVGGICFRDFEHACEYYGADKKEVETALKTPNASKFDIFNRLGNSQALAALG